MKREVETFSSGATGMLRKAWRVAGWTSLLIILTGLFLAIIERKSPLEAVSDFDLFLGFAALLICFLTAVIFEVVRSIHSTS
jgi:hypothetical protein